MDFNNMSLYDDISPQTLIIIGTALAVIFVLIACRIYCDIRVLRKGRKEQAERIRGLLLSNMLDPRKNISATPLIWIRSDISGHANAAPNLMNANTCSWGKISILIPFARTMTN